MKIIFVAIFAPDTNYTRDLSVYFQRILKKGDMLYLCGRKDEKILDNKSPEVQHIWRYGWRYFFDVLGYAHKTKPDIIHLQHEFKTYGGLITALMFPFLLLLLRIQGYPVVVTIHGVVSPKQVDFEFLENFNVKPNSVMKYVVIGFFHYVYKLILIFANRVTVHAPMLKTILASYLPFANDKIVVIEHGIREITDLKNKKEDNIVKQFPIVKGKQMILVFGHFSPRKGYEYLLKVYKQVVEKEHLQNWLLVLAGDVQPEFAHYWDKIIALIHEYKLDDMVLMTDFIKDAEIDEFYRNSAIVLIPAVVSFNTSGSLSLALAYKKPLLVANVKPLATEVAQNDFGLLYDQTGSKSLEKQLAKLMMNKELYRKLSKNLEKSVGKRYWTTIAKEHYILYESVIQK
jgi:glycosyltransferase involved in cell wall biosynthesis